MTDGTFDRIHKDFVSHLDALIARDVRRLSARGNISFSTESFDITADEFCSQSTSFIMVETKSIPIDDFKSWFAEIDYPKRFPNYTKTYPDLKQLEKKAFEHWLSLQETKDADPAVLIDVAAATSPFYRLARHELGPGCASYRSDLPLPEYGFKPGIDGDTIGCSGDNIPLPDGSVTRIYAHNAIEHFEGSSYGGFFREAQRLLAPGGQVYVTPLFVASSTFAFVSLSGIYRRLSFPNIPQGTELVYSDTISQPYALHIAPKDLKRIVDPNKAAMEYKLIRYKGGESYGVELGLLGTKRG